MCLGVVACPNKEHDFDWRVYLKRVSKQKTLTRSSRNHNFSVDVSVNECSKTGEESWHVLHIEGMAMDELLETIAGTCNLNQCETERLELSHTSHTKSGKTKRMAMKPSDTIRGEKANADGSTLSQLTLSDLNLAVTPQVGDVVEEDVSCDSALMPETVPQTGKESRKK